MVASENFQNQARLAPVIPVQNISRLLGNTLRSHAQPSIRKAVHQHSTRSGKRGGNGIHRRAAPRRGSPPRGAAQHTQWQAWVQQPRRRAAPRRGSPSRGAAKDTQCRAWGQWNPPPGRPKAGFAPSGGSAARAAASVGATHPPAATRSQSYAPALRHRPSQSAP